MWKFYQLGAALSIAITTSMPGVVLANQAVITINSSQTGFIDPYYGSQSGFVNPYYGSQPVYVDPYYGSQPVIVNPGRRSQTVIVNPSNTVIVNPGRRSPTVIVSPGNTYPGYNPIFPQSNCSSMIMGSPIASPVPMNTISGRFC